jgi:hypothetical protein
LSKNDVSFALQIDAFLGLDDVIFRSALHQFPREIMFVANVASRSSALHAVQRRLRDVDMPAVDQPLSCGGRKGQQQCTDMRSVHVRVGHQNDFG